MLQNPARSMPYEPYGKLFLRFLRFGFLAWGGPVAQIAMIRQELVEEEKWVPPEHFNRVLAVYQVLPGPEAHELCVYFGMLAGGRLGGLLAGLGFMLPGFVLMFALSWFYVTFGLTSPLFNAVFLGFQPAVAALIVRAVHRIGGHALHHNRWLWGLAILAGLAEWLGVSFFLTLLVSGAVYLLARHRAYLPAGALAVILLAGILVWFFAFPSTHTVVAAAAAPSAPPSPPSLPALFGYGLRSGLLTFGGAYTVIPFLRQDAVIAGAWLTDQQFLDGIALSGILPAPLIIFSTFVGYLGGGPLGALALTVGIFLPAFAFTLIGHQYVERLVTNQSVHTFLDGVTAGVIGLIAITALKISATALTNLPSLAIFALALLLLFRWKARTTVVWVVLGAGLLGLVLFR